jgi:hypothetical protein
VSANIQSREDIIAALRNKIAQILSIPASSVENGKSIWNLFPPNLGRAQAPEVTSFCLYVSNEFKIYLTEREWEAPTLEKLAAHIMEKQANPQHMLAQIKKDRESQKKGLKIALITFPVLFGLCGILIMSGARKPVTFGNILCYVGLIALMEVIVILLWITTTKNFNREIEPILQFYNSRSGAKA